VSFHHELQSLGRAGSVPSDHRILGHYLANVGDVWVQAFCGDLKRTSGPKQQIEGYRYPVGQILGCEDTAQTFFIINDQDAIGSFSGAELARFGHSNVLRNSEGGGGTERSNGSFLSCWFDWTLLTRGYTSCRDCAFAGQLGLDFLANGLAEMMASMNIRQ